MSDRSDTLSTIRYAIEVAANDNSAFTQDEYYKSLAELEALEQRIAELEAENATLAAGQCIVDHGLIGDQRGNLHCTLQARIKELEADLQETEAENAELRADAERLNYLEENQVTLYTVIQLGRRPTTATDGPRDEAYAEFLGWSVGNRHDELPTVREAIDAALRQRAGQESEDE